jgi:hypothetical protein
MAVRTGADTGEHAAASPAEVLQLADWRRRVADLYAEVRRLAGSDPVDALELWRTTRERLFREHPQSPVPEASRSGFRAHHFDFDPGMRFEAVVEPDEAVGAAAPAPISFETPPSLDLPVSAGGTMALDRIGSVEIPLSVGRRRLAVFWMAGYAGGLFIPFRDATNGAETYGAGRYLLDTAKSADLGGDAARGTVILDFNFAFHPSCAFDPKWACPLAPPENRLDIPIHAGERLA